MTRKTELSTHAAKVRPVLQAIARLVSTDRRAVILATDKAEVLLSNAPATRVGMDAEGLVKAFDWPALCVRARRAGSIAVSTKFQNTELEGELVHMPLGTADGFLLRLAETDQEAALLRNRTRTATLLRVSHDLRTPIQSLLAATDAIFQSEEVDAATADARRDQMQRSAQLALNHIDNVIKVIRGELTTADIQSDEDFSLTEEVRATLDMIKPIAGARGTAVSLHLDPAEDVHVHGPVRFVRALLQNMFDNSVKYGGTAVDVHVACTREPSNAQVAILVEVSDLGGGLPEAQKVRLMRAIDLADISLARQTGAATGPKDGRPSAGLNVLAHALGQLGGTLEVLDRGEDGKAVAVGTDSKVIGTILRARFDLAPADQIAPATIAPKGETIDGQTLAGVGVLVVEDSPSSRDWLVHCLRAAGASVIPVENGLRALEVLQNADAVQKVDLLLTDMTLPYINGIELVQRIIGMQSSGALAWQGKMLGLTAHIDEDLRAACLKLGMAQLLEKPIRSVDLCRSVHEVVRSAACDVAPVPGQKSGRGSDCSSTQPLAPNMVKELIEQLGLDTARGFMRRARSEAGAVFEDILQNGVRADTGRMIHAATGACGLTGLKLLERTLRELELLADAAQPIARKQLGDLEVALDVTGRVIEELE
ncbi:MULTISPECIES: hybrid sensor histidine kinase/response regulator [Roseobacteraceae]|uniref:histidine kinase n=1 Tax=Pseudosulfitobacter pseudonitzschiae TaxID=1402135 RepID=A0A221K7W1_9RHOB|nr:MULTISPECIES: hybrid sensor histidine kinase/response regulator [Roseobacteraceae]ASM74937.1 sensory/regulatory protein RpfC [Pseudosulfitobacter pseudonitzschiae]